jgi:hypothetical protein
LNSSTVRLSTIENIHIEHKPSKAGIYIRFTGITTIDALFYQTAYPDYALIYVAPGTNRITLKNIPHYVSGTVIKQERAGKKPAWLLEFCQPSFSNPDNWRVLNSDGDWEVYERMNLEMRE